MNKLYPFKTTCICCGADVHYLKTLENPPRYFENGQPELSFSKHSCSFFESLEMAKVYAIDSGFEVGEIS